MSATQKGGKLGRVLKPKVPDSGSVSGTIRIVAVADGPRMTGALAFDRGDYGELIYASDRGWLCVRVGQLTGWVPADYWRIITDVRSTLDC